MHTKSNILIAIAVIAVGLVSFISGRISVKQSEAQVVPTGVTSGVEKVAPGHGSPENPEANQSVKANLQQNDASNGTSSPDGKGQFVASKNGTRYFPVTCGSSKTIKPENAIYFQTAAEAEATGKTQSPQCKY